VVARYPQIAEELLPRLEAALWLQHASLSFATRPGFVYDSRKHLEKQIASMQPRYFWQQLFRRYSPQRVVFNVAAATIVILLLALIFNSADARWLSIRGHIPKPCLKRPLLSFNQLGRLIVHRIFTNAP
jgi:hypothetical protein